MENELVLLSRENRNKNYYIVGFKCLRKYPTQCKEGTGTVRHGTIQLQITWNCIYFEKI